MSAAEAASLIASVVSVILALIAIALSIVFYKMSAEYAESSKDAAKSIGASVDRLEKLFDKLYADTFSMMRDTVSDMRKHIWPDETTGEDALMEEAERKADEKVNALKADLGSEVSKILQRQQIADERLSNIQREMKNVVERAINTSRQAEVEAREETARDRITRAIRTLRRRGGPVLASEVLESLPTSMISEFFREIPKMREDGVLFYEGDEIQPDTKFSLIPPNISLRPSAAIPSPRSRSRED